VAGGRLVALLEGGYDLGALSRSLVEVLGVLDGHGGARDAPGDELDTPSADGLAAISRTLVAHGGQRWASEPLAVGDEPARAARPDR